MVGLLFISRYASSLIRTPGITSLQRLSQIRKFGKSPLRSAIDLGETHKPTNFQKRILVWAGSYKKTEEVPDRVSTAQLKRAMDLFRIRVNISMILATVVGCVVMIYVGRKLRDDGVTLEGEGTMMRKKWERLGAEERAEKAQENASK